MVFALRRFGISGFTLLELIITMIVLSLLALLAAPYASNLYTRSQLEDSATQTLEALVRAQSSSAGQRQRGRYSVRFETDRFTLFPGDAYHVNHPENEVALMPSTVTMSWLLNGGGQTVSYDAGSGRTDHYGTVTLTNETGDSLTIQIERTGLVYLP
jgi:prepilin-type N-terminal cleavage/methylation domain-containing protein